MSLVKNIFIFVMALSFTSCSFVYELLVQNLSKKKVELIFSPVLSSSDMNNKTPETIYIKNTKAYKISLNPEETIKIGYVQNKRQPDVASIDIDYLEIRSETGTIVLNNKNSILNALKQVDKFDWRVLVK
jgi:hypothetical protein